MEVFCGCGKLMGDIKEGSKLRKGYKLICVECQDRNEKTRQACVLFRNAAGGKSQGGNPFDSKNAFSDIFGDIFGKKA